MIWFSYEKRIRRQICGFYIVLCTLGCHRVVWRVCNRCYSERDLKIGCMLLEYTISLTYSLKIEPFVKEIDKVSVALFNY